MSEVATFRKNKIDLNEYDSSKDIFNRVLMARFSVLDVEILEEILYSSLRIPIEVLKQNLNIKETMLLSILERLSQTGLFKVAADHVLVDKEMRKYYEFQILKFEEDFKPGMDYLQGLLRKVPIHILPTWYSISRTSNNIFESIIEKYLETPLIFQRYLLDLHFGDPVQKEIMDRVYQSPNFEVEVSWIIKEFHLTQEEFEKHMLYLEFSFVCCSKFVKQEDVYKQIVTPFYEWQEYLCHIRDAEPTSIEEKKVQRKKLSDFALIEEMSEILHFAKKGPITTQILSSLQKKFPVFDEDRFSYYIEKFCALNLADQKDEQIICTSDSLEWLKMDLINRALYLHRHPLNYLDHADLPEELCQYKMLREAEKCLYRVVDKGWVFLDDFIKTITIPLKEEHLIKLIRQGGSWAYQFPKYSEKETTFFKALIQNWLFELGITALGIAERRECFTLTPFGQELFSNE